MPRKPRPRIAGATYHVTSQADGDDALYFDSIDRRVYLAFVARAAERHELEVHSWALMTNHSHLLFTTPAADVDRAMHRLNSSYAHWFNDAHGSVGHVFRRRYSASVVETEEHLHWCYRYIEMNPVKAGICGAPEQWRWSSYGWLFGGHSRRHDLPSNERHLLRHWGSGESARARLRRYVETGVA
jgi:putative transposase